MIATITAIVERGQKKKRFSSLPMRRISKWPLQNSIQNEREVPERTWIKQRPFAFIFVTIAEVAGEWLPRERNETVKLSL